jgi:biotin transport system substrate-specific component
MTTAPATQTSLLNAMAPARGIAAAIAGAVLGSLLLAVSAKIQVPFWPVPMTMQTLAVLVLGMAYGRRLGAATVLLYIAEGAMGLPVFAGPVAGPAYLAGPTGGFLIGFVAAAYVAGWLAERGWDRSPARAFATMAVGHAVLFGFGVAWLATLIGPERAIATGLTPFWAATLLKAALGAAVLQAAWTVVRRRSQA